MPVPYNLYLNVAWLLDDLFHVDFAVVKRALSFAGGITNGGLEIGLRIHAPHSFAATARSSLKQYRIAELSGEFSRLIDIGGGLFAAWNDWHIGGLCYEPRGGF